MNTVGKTLAVIDCSTRQGMLGIWHRGVWSGEILQGSQHGATLLERFAALLDRHRLHLGDLHALGVVTGPGSLTGIRLACAVAQGLAYTTGIRLLELHSLVALGWGLQGTIALDARMRKLYITSMHNGWQAAEQAARQVRLDQLSGEIAPDQPLYYVGLEDNLASLQAMGLHPRPIAPSLEGLGNYALAAWRHKQLIEPLKLEVNYLANWSPG